MTKQSEAATSLSSGISGSAAVRVLPAACQPSGPAAGCCERTASEWPDRGRRAWALLNPSTFPIEHVKLRRLLRGVSSFKKAYQIYLVCQCCSANATTNHLLGAGTQCQLYVSSRLPLQSVKSRLFDKFHSKLLSVACSDGPPQDWQLWTKCFNK